MKPGSPEYKAKTKNMLTASDMAAAVGLNPYCTRQELWERKVNGKTVEANANMLYGIEHEPDAINAYEVITGSLVTAGRFCENPSLPMLGCTPDGFIETYGDCDAPFGLLEAKCPQVAYKDIPAYYLCQMVGQIQITGASWCDFVVWTPEETHIYRMDGLYLPTDGKKYPFEWMYPRLQQMLQYIGNKEKPPRFRNGEKPDPEEFRALCSYTRIK